MIEEGQQLGGYQVQRKIGQGGMGDVFLAQHLRVSRRAAVKVLLPELSQKATVLDRFFNEARATSLIKHPGIVEIIDCDVLDGQAFIIMEYLEGESLGSYMNRTGALAQDPPFLLGVSAAIASAVGAAHSAGIVHRDLKPDNVYLHLASTTDPVVTVKILDFGIAKLLQQDGGPGTNKTQMGMMLGTPPYMSPEQCRDAGQVDKRCDIYSLGCILYELVCGAPPFVHENAMDMISAHLLEAPQPPIARVPKMLPGMNALILRMLAKKPDQRPQTMDEVVNELAACARSMGLPVEKPLRPRLPVERPAIAAEFLPTQTATGGIPRSRLTPLPLAGGNPSLRPVTPYSTSSRSAGAGESGRVRSPSMPMPETPSGGHVGGTRVMEVVRPVTTMGSAAAEVTRRPPPASSSGGAGKGRTYAMAAAAVVVVGGIVGIVGMRGGASSKTAAVSAPVSAPVAAPAPEKIAPPPAAEPPPVQPKPIVAAPALPATVQLDLQGLPARTTVSVDGRPASLPVQLPRGAQVHHVVLKPPSGPEKTFDYDGSVDRVVEVIFEKKTTSSASSSGGSEGGHRSHDKSAGKKKPGDRDAITDL